MQTKFLSRRFTFIKERGSFERQFSQFSKHLSVSNNTNGYKITSNVLKEVNGNVIACKDYIFLFQEAKLIFVEKWSFFVSFQIELHFLWFYGQIVDPKK